MTDKLYNSCMYYEGDNEKNSMPKKINDNPQRAGLSGTQMSKYIAREHETATAVDMARNFDGSKTHSW